MAKEEFVKESSYLYKSKLQDKLEITDRELEKFFTKAKALGMTEEALLSFLIKNFSKGAIKIKKINVPKYVVIAGKDTEYKEDTEE